jgi:N-acetylglucosaminyldiphosphoundecaprenol N-acetyl-beta-D-mannosaminyltransferase
MPEAVHMLIDLVERHRREPGSRPALVVTLNPEMVMLARRDGDFRSLLESATLLVPDGIGIVRALRRRGHPGAERVGGADLITAYLSEAERRGHRVALVGGAPGVARSARDRMVAAHPRLRVVAASAGAPDPATASRLREAHPDMLLVAFGAGRQEQFLAQHLGGIGAAAGIGVGGSLDFLAGRVRRAPAIVRRAGLEWAWRLAMQPWRFRRQTVLPVYWWLERREAARASASTRG